MFFFTTEARKAQSLQRVGNKSFTYGMNLFGGLGGKTVQVVPVRTLSPRQGGDVPMESGQRGLVECKVCTGVHGKYCMAKLNEPPPVLPLERGRGREEEFHLQRTISPGLLSIFFANSAPFAP